MLRRAAAVLLALGGMAAQADVFRPAYLELDEEPGGRYAVLWKVPALDDQTRLAAYVTFPPATTTVEPPRVVHTDGARVERWTVHHPGGLAGLPVTIEGSAVGITDVIARIVRLDGSAQMERLSIEQPRLTVKPSAGAGEVAWSYLVLGVEHILGGIDHLLFVLALLLIVRGGRRIVATVTAFTVAHSITLAVASFGWVQVPGPPVEALIALSIVFVAAEVVHGLHGRVGLTARAPWTVAFSFGLLHGLGFAGALSEVGLPDNDILMALLMFNAGVELGQLAFVAFALGCAVVLKHLWSDLQQWGPVAVSYGIGSVAAFWALERVIAW